MEMVNLSVSAQFFYFRSFRGVWFHTDPEGAVRDVDFPPGDDDGVFDGFSGNVNTEEGAVSIICHLDVNGETFCVLKVPRLYFIAIFDACNTLACCCSA